MGKSILVRVTCYEVRGSEGSSHRDSSVLQKAYFHLASFWKWEFLELRKGQLGHLINHFFKNLWHFKGQNRKN